MSLYRLLRAVGFEHEDAVGGLLPEHPARPLEERREALEREMHRLFERLVCHRRTIEALRQRIVRSRRGQFGQTSEVLETSEVFNEVPNERDLTQLRRHELIYRQQRGLFARLRLKQAQIREKLLLA
jgi:hypothetical protein